MPDQVPLHAEVHAWAKINLDLRILARENTGYHQLETIFQRIALADIVDVRITPGHGITVECTPSIGIPAESNLAWRAASIYRHAAGWPAPDCAIRIAVQKVIPTGGGLGGGSADAGAVLRALNALNPDPLRSVQLLSIAATLGADVPFLTTECARVIAWGRGERMLALDALPVRTVHCATFPLGVNTAMAYQALASARADGRLAASGSALLRFPELDDWSGIADRSANDFEPVLFALRDDIAAVHRAWSERLPDALVRMSGSGATVIAVVDTPRQHLSAITPGVGATDGVRLVQTATLGHVPPVRRLSPPIGSR